MKTFIATLCSALVLCGCSESGITSSADDQSQTVSLAAVAAEANAQDDDYYSDDWRQNSTELALTETTEINKAGTYHLTGSVNNGTLTVNAAGQNIVLVLDGVSITSSDSAALNIQNANKVVLLLPEGSVNTIRSESSVEDDSVTAALYAASDLSIAGSGSLSVEGGGGDGISSKGSLKITGGQISVSAANDGIYGKELLYIEDGVLTLSSGGGFQSVISQSAFGGFYNYATETESKKALKAGGDLIISGGSYDISSYEDAVHSNAGVTINGGSFDINCGDDGFHADGTLTIGGGEITIENCYEGLEGTDISLNGGDISINADDDGINVNSAGGDLEISGGTVTMSVEGDGIDSNCTVNMTGGTIYVNGPVSGGNGAIDYERSFEVTGGTLVAAGSLSMAECPSGGNQPSVMMYFNSGTVQANTEFTVKDDGGNTVLAYTPQKQYSSVCFSAPGLKTGGSYIVYCGGSEVVSFEITDTVTYLNEQGVTTRQGMGAMGGGMGGMGGAHGGFGR